jgi:hypothetical protein
MLGVAKPRYAGRRRTATTRCSVPFVASLHIGFDTT